MVTILTVALILLVAANVLSPDVKNVVSVEAGYAYILSARNVNPDSPHSLVSSLNYGYVIHDKTKILR